MALSRRGRHRQCGALSALCRRADRARRDGMARASAAAARWSLLARPVAARSRRDPRGVACRRAGRGDLVLSRARPIRQYDADRRPGCRARRARRQPAAALRPEPQGSAGRRHRRRHSSRGAAWHRPQRERFRRVLAGRLAQRDTLRRLRLPGSANHLFRRQRRGLARRHARPRRQRHRYEHYAARGRRPHHHASALVQGRRGARSAHRG